MPVTDSTFFDIGSITKAVATASVVARLVDRKEIRLNEKIASVLSELEKTGFEDIEVGDLLTHSSGVKAWHPLFKTPESKNYLKWITQTKDLLASKRDVQNLYSDLGFYLLQHFLEKKFGTIESLFEKEVRTPLNLNETVYGPLKAVSDVAATEYCQWRKKIIQCEVFDENTYSLGGKSAFAGLFSNGKDLVIWANAWLSALDGRSKWISSETAKTFTQKQRGDWGYGFDTKSKNGSLGSAFSENTFGHLGYPGTSVWIDPEIKTVVVFLTNRIHPSRMDTRIRTIRPKLHELIFEELKS